jgi:hypothetical protein
MTEIRSSNIIPHNGKPLPPPSLGGNHTEQPLQGIIDKPLPEKDTASFGSTPKHDFPKRCLACDDDCSINETIGK